MGRCLKIDLVLDFSHTVKAATLIFISGRALLRKGNQVTCLI